MVKKQVKKHAKYHDSDWVKDLRLSAEMTLQEAYLISEREKEDNGNCAELLVGIS